MSEQIIKALTGIESKFSTYEVEQRIQADRLLAIEQKAGGVGFTPASNQTSLGDKFIKSFNENRELFEKTRSVRLEIKAAGDPLTTSNARNIIMGGVGSVTGNVLGLQNALPTRPSPSTSAVEYSRMTATTGAAAQQEAEGDTKAAVRPEHSLIVQSALTIAGYTKLSRQALGDSGELRQAIDVTLRRSVNTALDDALVSGAVGFTGGYAGLATAYTSLVYTALVDAVSEGASDLQVAGFNPDVVALNPATWLAALVAKGSSNDHYLSGTYLGTVYREMRGLRVVLSPSVTAGKALVMDTSHSELLVSNSFFVEMAYSGDDFTKNLSTVLGEIRVIPTFRTTGSARLITPKA